MTEPTTAAWPEHVAEKVAQLLDFVKRVDPGIESISLGRDRAKHKRINDHAVAYGIRFALDELGLLPDD